MAKTVKMITRLYTGADGESHFEDIDMPLINKMSGRESEPIKVSSITYRETDGDFTEGFHCAAQKQLIIPIEGELEIVTGDGTTRRFGPGSILLAEDTTGKGHISRDNGKPRMALKIVLA